jgi:hypothetical protein
LVGFLLTHRLKLGPYKEYVNGRLGRRYFESRVGWLTKVPLILPIRKRNIVM